MANAPFGTNIWEGPLGVVRIEFDGVDLGKTTADTELNIDQDLKDIIYQQDGTKYADKVRTGHVMQLTATFGEITTALLSAMQQGFNVSGTGDSMSLSRDLYQSMRNAEGKVLIIKRVDSEGNSSTDPRHWLNFYIAVPEITGPVQWGADTQRNTPVTFHVFYDDTNNSFGFSGFASSLGL